MRDSDYKPYILLSINAINEGDYVLGILPNNQDENYYYEIHISTTSLEINNLKNSIGDYIFVEIISSSILDIWNGDSINECFSDGVFEYTSYDLIKTEKTNRIEWKPKFEKLTAVFKEDFKKKSKPYRLNRMEFIHTYKRIYRKERPDLIGENRGKQKATVFFEFIYLMFQHIYPEYHFHKFIDPAFSYLPESPKDWKEAYIKLEQKCTILANLDVDNYELIKNHMLVMSKEAFESHVPNYLLDDPRPDIKEKRDSFNALIEKIKNSA
ncbi:MAG: hypothetical protein GQ574_15970 [Crocinitomix sp.]|nr:hypothetical protein [Crocinitomix sp.]